MNSYSKTCQKSLVELSLQVNRSSSAWCTCKRKRCREHQFFLIFFIFLLSYSSPWSRVFFFFSFLCFHVSLWLADEAPAVAFVIEALSDFKTATFLSVVIIDYVASSNHRVIRAFRKNLNWFHFVEYFLLRKSLAFLSMILEILRYIIRTYLHSFN